MSIRAYRDIKRKKTKKIKVGKVYVGGDAPISVQTMTNTLTQDIKSTINQISRIEKAWRFSINGIEKKGKIIWQEKMT